MTDTKLNMKSLLRLIVKFTQYNLRIIFANKFMYFFGVAILIYIGMTIMMLFNDEGTSEAIVYGILMFTGVVVVAYPTIFGLQNDADNHAYEIIFGIPNYRYKVWMVRLFITFVATYFILLMLTFVSTYTIYSVGVFKMSVQIMFPLIFLGCLSFMLSTIVRSGNGTAVIMVILALVFVILAENLDESSYNIFLNPYKAPGKISEVAWQNVVLKNRLYLSIGSVLCFLYGLTKLQSREKFV